MDPLSTVLSAASFAADKHKHQKRKGSDEQPYINHPLEVARMLVDIGNVEDIDVIVAGLLHDTVEDCGVTFAELEQRFGRRVAELVQEVTDDKSLAKAERKRLQVEHAPHLSHGAKQIKLADKISNIRDVSDNPPEGWDLQRRREYVQWGENVVAGLRGANSRLETLFDETVADARRKLS